MTKEEKIEAIGDRVMTAREVADYFRLDWATVYRLAKDNEIPAKKVGGNGDL